MTSARKGNKRIGESRRPTTKRTRPTETVWIAPEESPDRERLRELLVAVRPILAAYRSVSAEITHEQINAAWAAYDAARGALGEQS